jgi:hypothetical protein
MCLVQTPNRVRAQSDQENQEHMQEDERGHDCPGDAELQPLELKEDQPDKKDKPDGERDGGTLYFSKFRRGSLREVIFGERCGLKPRFVLDLIRHSKGMRLATKRRSYVHARAMTHSVWISKTRLKKINLVLFAS